MTDHSKLAPKSSRNLLGEKIQLHHQKLIELGQSARVYQRYLRTLQAQENFEHQAAIRSIRLQVFNGSVVSAIVLVVLLFAQNFLSEQEFRSLNYLVISSLGQNFWLWLFIHLRPPLRIVSSRELSGVLELNDAWFCIASGTPSDFPALQTIEMAEMNSGVSMRAAKIHMLKRAQASQYNRSRTKRLMWQSSSAIFELIGLLFAGLPILAFI